MRDWGDRWLTIKAILDCHCKHMESWVVTKKKAWRYQRGNQKRKSKKDIQGSGHKKKNKNKTKGQTQKPNDWATQTLLKPGCEGRCSGRVGSSCFTFGTTVIAATTHLHLYVTHYDQQSGLSYCNLTTRHWEGTPIHHHWTRCRLDHGNHY
jgi:hypothetical protein